MVLYKIIRGFVTTTSTLINKAVLVVSGVSFGKHFGTCGMLHIRNYAKNKGIYIGNNVFINSCRMANPIGGDTKTILFAHENGKITIGDGVRMSNVTLFSMKGITIGDQSFLGGGTRVYDADFHSCNPEDRLNGNRNIPSAEVFIGKRCFIGANVIILKGVHIGNDVVVGAGSVVTKNIPAGQIWAGNPAKYIKDIK